MPMSGRTVTGASPRQQIPNGAKFRRLLHSASECQGKAFGAEHKCNRAIQFTIEQVLIEIESRFDQSLIEHNE